MTGYFNLTGAQFSIEFGDPDNMFVVDTAAQAIKVGAQPLDREQRENYFLVIAVKKEGKNYGYAKVWQAFQ